MLGAGCCHSMTVTRLGSTLRRRCYAVSRRNSRRWYRAGSEKLSGIFLGKFHNG